MVSGLAADPATARDCNPTAVSVPGPYVAPRHAAPRPPARVHRAPPAHAVQKAHATPRKKAVHRVAKARPPTLRAMVALAPKVEAPQAQLIAAGGRSRPLAVGLRSEGCDKDQPVAIMSPVPGVRPAGPPPSPLETVLVPVPPPSGDVSPQTWVVTDRPVPPTPDDRPGGGVFVPFTGGGGGGVSPTGVGPTAVPEPGTWAMMLAGFLGVGAALRRNRATARRLDKSPAAP